ncbi:MAG: hypothetical protein K0R57_261 [Paenibacillaceae bacterium]|jgi:hypothetical protein|nr:hypothetical protein [Paenibacillaceae bacterium]
MALPLIDIVIPAIEKDLGTLPFVIDAIRKQVKHPIGQILIVAPRKQRIVQLCQAKGCRFVHEDTVLPITKKDIHYRSKRWERSGWLYQQLLKLGADKLGSADYYLVVDADTVLIRPHVFRSEGKTVLYTRNWSQNEYFVTYRKLMGKKAAAPASLVTHYMLFERARVAQLKRDIEARHGTSWYKAIIRSMNRSKQFAFSEFETYGNYLYDREPGRVRLRKALNKSLHQRAALLSPQRLKRLAARYRSVSFHERKAYSRKGQ